MKTIKLIDVIVFLFVLLFIYAAASKLMEFDAFEAQLGKSPLILEYSKWLVYLVPSIEILISIALLVPTLQLPALYASFSLMFLFSAYIAFMLIFSPYIPCSCGGILSKMGWTEHLIFNIAFTLLAVLGVFLNIRQTKETTATFAL